VIAGALVDLFRNARDINRRQTDALSDQVNFAGRGDRNKPCIQCAGDLELRGDRATSTARGVLREIALVCRCCHAPRTLWFRIVSPAAN
jgi:hypothetical protein